MNQERVVETTLRVRFSETDAMGIVYHANYLVWFEVGRGDYFRAIGQDYGEWEKRGYLLPVSDVCARYEAPAHYGELVTIQTWLIEVRSRSVKLGYQVCHEGTGQHLVSGWTKHICTDPEGRVRRLPQEMLAALNGP